MNHFEEIHKFRTEFKNENHSGNVVSGSKRWLSLKDISWTGLFRKERYRYKPTLMLPNVCKGLQASS